VTTNKKRVTVMVPVTLIVDTAKDTLRLETGDEELQFLSDLESAAAIEYDRGNIIDEEDVYL
jgi:hypothetical protein